jgi:hypothetical protein
MIPLPATQFNEGHTRPMIIFAQGLDQRFHGLILGLAERLARLTAAAVCALALSACSKCDAPDWWGHRNAPAVPQSCHDDAGAK